jgi:hypothetical protein
MKTFAKITAFALIGAIAAIVPAGCNATDDGKNSYTFRFKVDNDTNLESDVPQAITKVEFINGDRQNDYVLYQTNENFILHPATRSMEYIVYGFKVEDEHDAARRVCGVRVTLKDGTTLFSWDAFGHRNKILVSVYYSPYYENYDMDFSDGNW